MTTSQLVIVCITLLCLAGLAALVVAFAPVSPKATPLPSGATVLLHVSDGIDVKGTVTPCKHGVLLADAHVVAGGKTQPLGGSAHVPAYEWAQILT